MHSIKLPEHINEIEDRTFAGCIRLKDVVIPGAVTHIGERAFAGCISLLGLVIPDAVTSIDDEAFYGCGSLRSIVIPDSVTTIGDRVFSRCASLESVVIPASVTEIGENAFQHCLNIKEFTCKLSHAPKIGPDFFDDEIYSNCTLYVPDESVDKYRNSRYAWHKFKNILPLSKYDEERPSNLSVYTMDGNKVSGDLLSLSPGTYIIKDGDRSREITL
jgi:hypothetical protein